MARSPEKAEGLGKRVAWCPSPISDGDHGIVLVRVLPWGSKILIDVLDTKSQNKEK